MVEKCEVCGIELGDWACNVCINSDKVPTQEPCCECTHSSMGERCLYVSAINNSNNGNAAGAVHYHGEVQPLEFMQAVFSPERFKGFLQGNVIKYAARIGKKDDSIKDAQKIRQYAHWLVMALEGKKIDPRKDVL